MGTWTLREELVEVVAQGGVSKAGQKALGMCACEGCWALKGFIPWLLGVLGRGP